METYCSESGNGHSGGGTVGLSIEGMRACRTMGLTQVSDVQVLGVLVRNATICGADDAVVMVAAWELAEEMGLSVPAVKRSLAKLIRLGLIVRRQDVRRAGELAKTQVTRKACALFGRSGGATIPTDMPTELKTALAGESVKVCDAVAKAWNACEGMPAQLAEDWRGGAGRLANVRALLGERAAEAAEQALATAEKRERETEQLKSGLVPIPLPGGAQITVDAKRLDAGIRSPADLGFAKDAIIELGLRRPDLVTPTSAPRLLAEILYSRAVGFVAGKEYTAAVRILTSTIAKPANAWGRPRGMWDSWYSAASAACRFSTASSSSVH